MFNSPMFDKETNKFVKCPSFKTELMIGVSSGAFVWFFMIIIGCIYSSKTGIYTGNILTSDTFSFFLGLAIAIAVTILVSHIPSRQRTKARYWELWNEEKARLEEEKRLKEEAEQKRLEEEKRFKEEQEKIRAEKERIRKAKEEEENRKKYLAELKEEIMSCDDSWEYSYGEKGKFYKGDEWFEEKYGYEDSRGLEVSLSAFRDVFRTEVQEKEDGLYREKYGEEAYFAMLRDRRGQAEFEELQRHNNEMENARYAEIRVQEQAIIAAQRQHEEMMRQQEIIARQQEMAMAQQAKAQEEMMRKQNAAIAAEQGRRDSARKKYQSAVSQAQAWRIVGDDYMVSVKETEAKRHIGDLL